MLLVEDHLLGDNAPTQDILINVFTNSFLFSDKKPEDISTPVKFMH